MILGFPLPNDLPPFPPTGATMNGQKQAPARARVQNRCKTETREPDICRLDVPTCILLQIVVPDVVYAHSMYTSQDGQIGDGMDMTAERERQFRSLPLRPEGTAQCTSARPPLLTRSPTHPSPTNPVELEQPKKSTKHRVPTMHICRHRQEREGDNSVLLSVLGAASASNWIYI